MISDENNNDNIDENEDQEADSQEIPEEEKTIHDYTEEEIEEMDEDEKETLIRRAKTKARLKRDAELEELRFGLRQIQTRIKKMLEIQKNMGKFPDVDGKHAVSLCISALARHNDEKAIRTALNACLAYLKNHKEREEYEIKEEERRKRRAAEEAAKAKEKKGFFSRK